MRFTDKFRDVVGDGDEKDGNEVGCQPVGLAKGAKYAGLDILNPTINIKIAGDGNARNGMAEVFREGVESCYSGANQKDKQALFDGLFGKAASDCVVEKYIGDGGDEATVEAGVVTPEAGVDVD